jgi:hypothetical protein
MMPPVQVLNIRRGAHSRASPWRVTAAPLALAAAAAIASDDPGTLARELVAAQVGIAPAEVRVWAVTPRTFADAGLGCPAPGMAYAQVLTPGHVVVVEADGRRFDVRVAGNSGRICHAPKGTAPAARPAPRDPAGETAANRARHDLAGVIGVPADAIAIVETHARGPKEGLPGCGGAPAGPGETVLTLGVDGRQYRYVLRGDVATPCPGNELR